MHVLRFTRLVFLSALCLAVLLVAAPSVEARSLTHAQPLNCMPSTRKQAISSSRQHGPIRLA